MRDIVKVFCNICNGDSNWNSSTSYTY